jgi:protein-S-isoprenylcysteine O-methyltransferase Ste14
MPLALRALAGVVQFQLISAALLFLPAGTLRFQDGWLYWGVISVATWFITLYFLKYDPALLERRLKAGARNETEPSQKLILVAATIFICGTIVTAGLDYRFHWSSVPFPVVALGNVLVAVGFALVFFVFRANSFAGGTITHEAGQTVVSTGPYRFVRHPMYSGALLTLLGTPLALGSYWAFCCCIGVCGTLAWRTVEEERYLALNLDGYSEYCRRVRYRFVPGLW